MAIAFVATVMLQDIPDEPCPPGAPGDDLDLLQDAHGNCGTSVPDELGYSYCIRGKCDELISNDK